MRKVREFCLVHHIPALWDVPMRDYTSFRIGGPADALLFPENETALLRLIGFLTEAEIRYRVIGNGTNLLVADEGFRGVLISTRRQRQLGVQGDTVRAAVGVPLNTLCRLFADQSLTGGECLYGIPGTVGGALVMNAGAFGGCVSDTLSSVTVYSTREGSVRVLSREESGFGYRKSVFQEKRELILLSAEFSPQKGEAATIRNAMRELLVLRAERQPTALPSAGSAFLKPENGYAGRLIEEAGLSGYAIGGAAVSLHHAGFIVNLGDATARDVRCLMNEIIKKVEKNSGIRLIPEIEYIE